MNSYKSFIHWLGPREISVYLTLLVISLLLENFGFGLLIPLIDALESGTVAKVSIGPITIQEEISLLIALVLSVLVLRVGFTLATIWFGSQLTNSWSERMRVQLHDALHDPIDREPHRLKSGEILNTIMGETWSATEYIRALLDLISRGLALVAYVALLTWLSWGMTIGLVFTALPIAFIGYRLNCRTRRISRTILNLNNDLYQCTANSVGARFTIAVYCIQKHFRSIFAERSAELRVQHVKADVYGSIVPQILSLIVVPVVVGLGLYARDQSMPTGEIVVYILVVIRAVPQASSIFSKLNLLSRHKAGFRTVIDRLQSWAPLVDVETYHRLDAIKRIDIKEVSFAYNSSEPTIIDFTSNLIAGKTYRLHGASGTGKSTIISLILGLLTPSSGEIYVNGLPLSKIDLTELRHQIGYAGQRSTIFEDSIQENIKVWRNLSNERLHNVERALGIEQVCAALPDGRSTRVGTGGLSISGGQMQRIAIARAIAGAPSLLILDEATSELDLCAEHSVMTAIHEICPNCIVLIVSHRVESDSDGRRLWIELSS